VSDAGYNRAVADPLPTVSLPGTANMYGGFTVDESALPPAPEFAPLLERSLPAWRSAGYRAIWLRIPEQLPDLVPIAVRAGFRYHHAGDGAVMLALTLDAAADLPNHGTHMIGAGGVVLDGDGRLLVVSERYRRDRTQPYYKLPGGALDPGENLREAVIREVREETGIEAAFEGVVCMRHRHEARFGLSDLYVICRLRALSTEIEHDPSEIDECRWMAVDEFLSSNFVAGFNREIVRRAMSGVRLADVGLEQEQGYEFLA